MILSIKRSTEDVAEMADQMGYRLSTTELNKILRKVIDKHDASVGINWEVIQIYITEYVIENNIEKTHVRDDYEDYTGEEN